MYVAKRASPVLLTGEAGSPFETVARYLHKNGTPWVSLGKGRISDRYADGTVAEARRAAFLYVGDIAQYSRNIQFVMALLSARRNTAASGRSHLRAAGRQWSDGIACMRKRLAEPLSGVGRPHLPLRMQHEDIPS